MTTARRGIANHEVCESIERCHKHLLRLGFSEADATRGAVTLTAYFSGECSREQAFKVGHEITAKLQRTTAGVTPADSIETHHHRT